MEVFEAPLRIRRRRSPGGGLEGGGEGGERGLEGRGGEGGLEGRGGEGGGLEGGGGGLQVEVPTVRWWLLEGGHSHMHTNANR